MLNKLMPKKTKNPIRIVTAASLFDGHDAAINIMRRIFQDQGAEVIHLGHNRSVFDVVKTALQEGAQGIAISSYQGGHMEYFKYLRDLLNSVGAGYVQIYGGGGGVIIHEEKKQLESYGIAQIFHPDDGRRLGLEGMCQLVIEGCDFNVLEEAKKFKAKARLQETDPIPSLEIGLALTAIEEGRGVALKDFHLEHFAARKEQAPLVLGITGTGGAGKSSLIDELIQRFLNAFPDKKISVICVDPSKRKTGGSLLGDRIRMNSLSRDRAFMRSVASRGSGAEISAALPAMLKLLRTLDFDLIIAETSGIGQGNVAITEVSDLSLYVMTADFGAPSQLEKIDMLDFADMVAINKADHKGSQDALRDVSKQYRRSRKIWDEEKSVPVYLTQASQFNDAGVNQLFLALVTLLNQKENRFIPSALFARTLLAAGVTQIIPAERQSYLADIVAAIRGYKSRTEKLATKASLLGAIQKVSQELSSSSFDPLALTQKAQELKADFTEEELKSLETWNEQVARYKADDYVFSVRGKEFRQKLFSKTLSGSRLSKVATPRLTDLGDRFRFLKLENWPGEFPYTGGVFPLRRADEDPKRMFAGEGGPARTNRRFHFLTQGERAHRLSTAFDSVTLYGQDPDPRPDIFGKVGESGVSVCCLEDMKTLFAGFDLCAPSTSVSMTINGPAPMILAFYFNAAIDQQQEKQQRALGRELTAAERKEVSKKTLEQLRGTVQADILKEDQGQNTCIFSIHFALKMMGDIQQYFVQNNIRNFYSVSISGYHIAEAGANPISQIAFTLANGFTFVEYYLARGMKIDEFAPNLSFFFSNGLDAEYTVLGRVARRIWAIALRDLYQGNERSQKLKYHIQTSGRSLHAQEIDFNDIRTTLQALLAINDNCNSLHTNAYDEAITTPTEESVRRAMAIQMIINKEYGLAKNENSTQGAFIIEELTDLVEEAVLAEFVRLNERGGVLGAMETHYQRSKIQDESMRYEHLKHSGELPIVGVNTFINPKTEKIGYAAPKIEMARASYAEKQAQLDHLRQFQQTQEQASDQALSLLKEAALRGDNVFAALMVAARSCSLFQMTQALFEVGGQYRRNI